MDVPSTPRLLLLDSCIENSVSTYDSGQVAHSILHSKRSSAGSFAHLSSPEFLKKICGPETFIFAAASPIA